MRSVRLRCALAVAGALILTAGCGSDDSPAPKDDNAAQAEALGHVHGLGVDPGDGTLYAATHFGVFRVGDGGDLVRIADRWQDTMGFTIVGEGHFLGSGHPDLREDLPPHLGLIESTDAGQTWQPLALQGEADFHALEPAGEVLYAYDGLTGALMVTEDRSAFRTVVKTQAVDLAADPRNTDRVLVTTPRAGVLAVSASTGRQRQLDSPPLVYLDWPRPDLLVGLGPTGAVAVSTDGAKSWSTRGQVTGGEPAALEVTEGDWYAASADGLYASTDHGASWKPVAGQ